MRKICPTGTLLCLVTIACATAAAARPSPQEGMLAFAGVDAGEVSTISPRPSQVLRTPSAVVDLAADGDRAAVSTAGEWGCGPVGIWTRRAGARWLRDSDNCGDADETSGLVLAGTRAAWMYEVDTNQLHYTALVTGTPGSRARTLTIADHDEHAYLGNLTGDGSLLVYNTWKEPPRSMYMTEPKLWRLAAGGKPRSRRLLARWDAIDVVSVDRARIAMLRPDGSLAILSDRGRRLSAFRLGWKRVKAVRLIGSQLIVLRGRTIEVRDATHGTVRRRWRTARGTAPITLEDADGNFAAYRLGRAIHLLRLSDGRDRALAIANQAGPAHAELERGGLYYAYNEEGGLPQPGRVAFVPLKELMAQFRERR